jgi:hypothetical protein
MRKNDAIGIVLELQIKCYALTPTSGPAKPKKIAWGSLLPSPSYSHFKLYELRRAAHQGTNLLTQRVQQLSASISRRRRGYSGT